MIKENTPSMLNTLNINFFSVKSVVLVSLCLQNAGYTLLRKYTTKYENVSSKEILLVSEIMKLCISIYLIAHDTESKSDAQGTGWSRLWWLAKNSKKMLVLAVIYGIMNILSFVALEYIGAGEFTICAQLKILTTAGFSVLVLGTSLSFAKWRALMLLVLGCILVASPTFNTGTGKSSLRQGEVVPEEGALTELMSQGFGFAAVLTEVVLSGFASIYFEKVVKSTTETITIWERNFQLCMYSLLMYGGIILYESYASVAASSSTPLANGASMTARPAWSNWTWITLTVAALGATGGLLVAATLKYADAILKTLAAAGAIVISTVLGHYLLGGPLDMIVSIGACVTILAIANYTLDK
jgi:UDP-sugar transporter A1/2/3|eukprot:gene10348-7354_t